MRFQQAPYRIADVVALLFILHGNTSFGSLAPIIPYRSCKRYLADPNLTAYDSKYTTWYAQSFRVPEYTSIIYNVIAGDYTPEEAGEACAALAQKILDDDSIMKYTK